MPIEYPIWTPSQSRVELEPLTKFTALASRRAGTEFADYEELYRWSIEQNESFWDLVWDFGKVIGSKGDRILVSGHHMLDAKFFPDARLNFAENLLRMTGTSEAIVSISEQGNEQRLTWDDLRELVSQLQQLLLDQGVCPGDRVAAMLPNIPEAVAAMLAAASIGAIWASCSPDYGEGALWERFAQVEPVVLLIADGYRYAGKMVDTLEKGLALAEKLPSVRQTVIIEQIGQCTEAAELVPGTIAMSSIRQKYRLKCLSFEQFPFDHPLVILFSSGTTGKPKCIVHSAGGTLLQHIKEHQLHCGMRTGDRLFYFTTCAWMMWNWLVSALASSTTLYLYDGSPFYPTESRLFDLCDREAITHFGTSAKYIDAARKMGIAPIRTHRLEFLRTILSTGSPLPASAYWYVYESVKPDLHLASIAGGTDIIGCFILGVPTQPVWPAEIQAPGLGLAVAVLDDDGHKMAEGRGELACTRAFPSMPVGFWNDPDRSRYRGAYFERFDNIWVHGDFAEWTQSGGMIIHGRSDATLNPGGVRIGTAEIYAQVEEMPEILEAACVGQAFEDDVRILLFVKLADGVELDEVLDRRIRQRIRSGASPRHVPAKILSVPDLPRTKSGKITELAIRNAVEGRPITNAEALANPETLTFFRNLPQLSS